MYSFIFAEIFRFFSYVMPIPFEIVHTCVSLNNANAYEALVTVTNILQLAAALFLHIYDDLNIPF